MSNFLARHYWKLLAAILVFAFLTRIYRLAEPKTYVFDEVYHAVTAKLIRRNDPRAYEWWNPPIEPNTAVDWLHPPYAKYTQALGMEIFGENSFGWRISSVIFGTLVILVMALLAQELFEDKPLSLLAAFLAALDGLLLVQSRIAMNDIHVTFFILLSLFFYVRFRKSKATSRHATLNLLLTGLCGGLACGSKWSGVFVVATVGLFEAFFFFMNWRKKHFPHLRFFFSRILFLVLLPMFMYLLAYTHMFLQGKTLVCQGNQIVQGQCYCSQDSSEWVIALEKIDPSRTKYWESLEARGRCKRLISHFSELHQQIFYYQTHLKATHAYQSRPWQWFLDVRPVWMYVEYGNGTVANIYNLGNPALFWIGDIAILWTVVYLIFQIVLKKKIPRAVFFLFFILTAYFMVWLPWELSPRIMFFYHYTPAVPLLSIILSYWLMKLWQVKVKNKQMRLFCKALVVLSVASIFTLFVLFYANWTALPVSTEFAKNVYSFLPSWK